MEPQTPFPFMKLPIELRLMVYERLPIQIKRHDFNRLNNPRNPSAGSYSFAVVSNSIDLSILTTCRQVRTEASAIMHTKMDDILQTPPRLIIDLASTAKIHKCGGPLWHISNYLARRAVAARKSLGTVPYVGTGMGASGARYIPDSDPDYPLLVHLMARWFRSLDHQRISASKDEEVRPSIEMALTSPENWPRESVLYALRQLAYVLFAEHGGFQFKLRNVEHLSLPRTKVMSRLEREVIDKVMAGRTGDAVRAVAGRAIGLDEYEADWSDNCYALI